MFLVKSDLSVYGSLEQRIPTALGVGSRVIAEQARAVITNGDRGMMLSFEIGMDAAPMIDTEPHKALTFRSSDGGLIVAAVEGEPRIKPGFCEVVMLDARTFAASMLNRTNTDWKSNAAS